MLNKLFTLITGLGLMLILLTFNPFILPNLYLDSSGSFSFVSLHKVFLLAILNCIPLVLWLIESFKAKKLLLNLTKAYIPIGLWLTSVIISALFSSNQLNSLFGYNATFSNSFIELLMIMTFFLILLHKLESELSLKNILRFLNLAVSIAIIWILVRYSINSPVQSIYFREYLNSVLFTPAGNYASLFILSIVFFTLNLGFILENLKNLTEKKLLIFDSATLVILGVGVINFLNVSGQNSNYFYTLLFLVPVGLFSYIIFKDKELQKHIKLPGVVFSTILIVGFGSYFLFTHKVFESINSSSLPLDLSNSIAFKSISSSTKNLFIGSGSGNFTYEFDKYKPDNLTINNFTRINAASPLTPELRVYHSGAYFFEILSSQGILGIVSFLAIFLYIMFRFLKKDIINLPYCSLFATIAFIISFLLMMINSYDFSLSLTFWILLAIVLFFDKENEIKVIEVSKRASIPILFLLLIISGTVLFYSSKLISANVSMFNARRAYAEGGIDSYKKLANDAVITYPNSDMFLRESANANWVAFLEQSKKGETDSLKSLQKEITDRLNKAIALFPEEYRNYYFLGTVYSYSGLNQDNLAINYFSTSLSKNPYHAPTYYELAVLYDRSNNNTAAFANIRLALNYDQLNIYYKVKYADILTKIEGYDQALRIYQSFKDYKDNNSDKAEFQQFYRDQDIDSKLEAAKKIVAERKK